MLPCLCLCWTYNVCARRDLLLFLISILPYITRLMIQSNPPVSASAAARFLFFSLFFFFFYSPTPPLFLILPAVIEASKPWDDVVVVVGILLVSACITALQRHAIRPYNAIKAQTDYTPIDISHSRSSRHHHHHHHHHLFVSFRTRNLSRPSR